MLIEIACLFLYSGIGNLDKNYHAMVLFSFFDSFQYRIFFSYSKSYLFFSMCILLLCAILYKTDEITPLLLYVEKLRHRKKFFRFFSFIIGKIWFVFFEWLLNLLLLKYFRLWHH